MIKNKFIVTILAFTVMFTTVSCSQSTNKIIDKGVVSTHTAKDDSNTNPIESEMGNIINGGFVAQQGDWLYYSNGGYESIRKSKLNGNEKFTYDYYGGSCINVVDDWIYYIAISETYGNEVIKIKTDGTNRTKLLNVHSNFLYVKGEWVYYTVMDTGNLFRAKTDGTSIQKLSDDNCMFVNIVGDTIYYCNILDNRKVYKIVNNKKSKIIDSTCTYINVVGDWIYFIDKSNGEKVFRAKTDGEEKTVIIDQTCGNLNVSGDWVYFTIDDSNIHKAKLDGTEQETISVNFETSEPCLSIFGEWIYYFSPADGFKICKISTNGIGKSVLD